MILDETNRKNLIFLILQFLHEEGYEKSLHLYGVPPLSLWFWVFLIDHYSASSYHCVFLL